MARYATDSELLDSLSNVELAMVLDGGSARRVAAHSGEDWVPAWIDLDGLWIDDPSDPGYVVTVGAWLVDLPY